MLTWVTCPPLESVRGVLMLSDCIEEGDGMAKKRYRPEEIISKLCEAEVLIRQGKKVVEVIKNGCGNVVHRTGQPLGERIQ